MTARVLVVDDIATNARLLEARLSAEYFEVTTASSGPEALAICSGTPVDMVLLDAMMPGMDGFEVCRRLKADPKTHHIPVVMVTALDQNSDRLRGLEVGADDFLTKPVDDVQLMARVRSLTRLKALTDELRARALTGQQIAIEDAMRAMASMERQSGRVLIIEVDPRQAERLATFLARDHTVDVLTDPADAVFQVADRNYDLVVVSTGFEDFDPLRICSQIRTLEKARTLPIILIADEHDKPLVVRALDLGINDFVMRPIERHELAARVKTQIKRHRYTRELRESVSNTMALAVIDELTGLYNRRYFDRHLAAMLSQAQAQDRNLALIMLDMDHFKTVNDTYGHAAGDFVLRELAQRLRRTIRGVDLACRFGGEEFVVLMPDTDFRSAETAAERMRLAVSDARFTLEHGPSIELTVSMGVALTETEDDTPEAMLKRADVALYRAKRSGRNRVVFDAA